MRKEVITGYCLLSVCLIFIAGTLAGCPPPESKVTVPSVVGLTQANAAANLTLATLTVGTVTTQYHDTVAAGNVISQNPSAGASVNEGSAVNLVVSLGPDTPNIVPGEMVSVQGGAFTMGDPWSEGDGSELPTHSVTLTAYEIGTYEVTNQEFVDILNWGKAQGYLDTASSSTATAYGVQLLDVDGQDCQIRWTGTQFAVKTRDSLSMADFPALYVTWYGAAVYCNWLSESQALQPCYNTTTWACDFSKNGYHLPTEAQWERAAAWTGSSHYRYGNGSNAISCVTANYYDDIAGSCNPQGLSSSPYTSQVGSYTATSPAGCYDMAGNVFEWCNDWFDSNYYAASPATDPTGPATGLYRVLRGGSWYHVAGDCRAAFRYLGEPVIADVFYGFRIAK